MMQSLAISSGVTGRVSLCSRVVKDPVIAQLKMVGFMAVIVDLKGDGW